MENNSNPVTNSLTTVSFSFSIKAKSKKEKKRNAERKPMKGNATLCLSVSFWFCLLCCLPFSLSPPLPVLSLCFSLSCSWASSHASADLAIRHKAPWMSELSTKLPLENTDLEETSVVRYLPPIPSYLEKSASYFTLSWSAGFTPGKRGEDGNVPTVSVVRREPPLQETATFKPPCVESF